MTRRCAPAVRRWTDPAVAVTAAAAAATPQPPSRSWRPNTPRAPPAPRSALAREALEGTAAVGIEPGHLPGEVPERDVAELVHERRDLGPGAQVGVLVTAQRGPVEVRLALPAAGEQPLAVQARHHRHERRVRPILPGPGVQGVHHLPDRGLPASPDDLHDLGLDLVERRRERRRLGHLRSTVVGELARGKTKKVARRPSVATSSTIERSTAPW